MTQASGASAQPHLYIKDTKRMPVPIPPLPEQYEIVHRVEALFKLADMIEKRVESATKRADKLTQAILAKAFRGELVPTEAELASREGRGYEPASVLLERILAERKKSATTKGDGRRPRRSQSGSHD
jgi:type I restriction enzyme S subunit